jgi:hypothetical protein
VPRAAATNRIAAKARVGSPYGIDGCRHMLALTRYLAAKYGFRPREAEWLTVSDF